MVDKIITVFPDKKKIHLSHIYEWNNHIVLCLLLSSPTSADRFPLGGAGPPKNIKGGPFAPSMKFSKKGLLVSTRERLVLSVTSIYLYRGSENKLFSVQKKIQTSHLDPAIVWRLLNYFMRFVWNSYLTIASHCVYTELSPFCLAVHRGGFLAVSRECSFCFVSCGMIIKRYMLDIHWCVKCEKSNIVVDCLR